MSLEDLTGKIFYKLTVLGFSGKYKEYGSRKQRHRLWLCKCECGKEKLIPTNQLNNGKHKSCGCFLLQYRSINARKPNQQAAKTQIYCAYRSGAKRRNIEFNLDKEDFEKLISQKCVYCNIEPQTTIKKISGSYSYNGIDRVDNSKGYTLDNVVTCCETCNRAKLQMSKEEFLDWIKRVYVNIYNR